MKRLFLLFLLYPACVFATFNIWTPKGQLAGLTGKSNPNVLYETSGCVVVASPCFKMWTGINNGSAGIDYYESLDGLTSWTASGSNPIVTGSGAKFPTVYKVGSTYYLYTSNFPTGAITVQTSSNGTTWGGATTAISLGTAGQWDDSGVAQLNLVPNGPVGGVYYAYYEGIHSGGSSEGLATSPDLITWTKGGSNPIFTVTAPGAFQYINGTYYFWAPHEAVPTSLSSQGEGFNSLERFSAPAPGGPWTELTFNSQPVGVIYCSIVADFDLTGTGSNTAGTSVSDPYIISALGNMYIYWTRTTTSGAQSGINAAVATGITPVKQVSGYEGMVGFPIPNTANPPLNLNTLASDNFQRANANPIGGNWTQLSHVAGAVASQLVSHLVESSTAASTSDSWYNAVSFPNDQWSSSTIKADNASYAGANVRMDTSDNQIEYRAYWHGAGNLGSVGVLNIDRLSASYASLGQLSLTVSIGDQIMVAISGSNLLAYYNGYPVLAATDTTMATGSVGFMLYVPGATVSDAQISAWSGGGFVAAPSLLATGQVSTFMVGP